MFFKYHRSYNYVFGVTLEGRGRMYFDLGAWTFGIDFAKVREYVG